MDGCDSALIHGGDTAGFVAQYGSVPLDFSINVNPLGVPEGVRRAICTAAGNVDRYPDPLCRDLRAAIAQNEGVDSEQVFCAAGAADIIYRLTSALRPRLALIPVPTFAEYELALTRQGCTIERHLLNAENDFALTEAILPRLRSGVDIVFLCNPNNPTGRLIDPALLKTILTRCAENNIRMVVDECFLGFALQPAVRTLVSMLPQYENLVILKAFTKLYGMAGARLGYCLCSDLTLMPLLYEAGPPWPVSSLAQTAGVAALSERDYVVRSCALIAAERVRLHAALSALGFRCIPSDANYILFFSALLKLHEKLCQKGILIRSCTNFEGLGTGWYRIAVRTPQENDRLIAAIKQVTEGIL